MERMHLHNKYTPLESTNKRHTWVGVWVGGMAVAGSVASGAMANKVRKPGEQVLNYATKPAYLTQAEGWNSERMAAMQGGQSDPYLAAVADIQRKQSMDALMKMEYGVGGTGPSNYGTLQAGMAARGLPYGAGANRSLATYASQVSDKERAIDDSLNRYLMEGNYNVAQSSLANAAQYGQLDYQYQTPTSQWQTQPSTGGWDTAANILGGIGQAATYGAFNNSNAFQGSGTSGAQAAYLNQGYNNLGYDATGSGLNTSTPWSPYNITGASSAQYGNQAGINAAQQMRAINYQPTSGVPIWDFITQAQGPNNMGPRSEAYLSKDMYTLPSKRTW